jgi:hypothetical protein
MILRFQMLDREEIYILPLNIALTNTEGVFGNPSIVSFSRVLSDHDLGG